MTIYPATGYNSFLGVAAADTKLAELGVTAWAAKSVAEKETALITGTVILQAQTTVSTSCDFPAALVMLMAADIASGGKFITFKAESGKYKKAKVGSLSVEFKDDSATTLPTTVAGLVSQCLKDSGKPKTQGFTIV